MKKSERLKLEEWALNYTLYYCCEKCKQLPIRYEGYKNHKNHKDVMCYHSESRSKCPAYTASYKEPDASIRNKILPPEEYRMKVSDSKLMLDMVMVDAAPIVNTEILEVDKSWRKLLSDAKNGMMMFPYPSESYNAIVMKHTVSVEGYKGVWRVSKICKSYEDNEGRRVGVMYRLNKPVVCKDYRIYGVFDNNAKFIMYRVLPLIGFHFHGSATNDMIPQLCTGDLQLPTPHTLQQLKDNCKMIIKSQEVINADSIGNVHIPKFYGYIRNNISKGTISRISKKIL
jgi:hypothetical protein